MSVRGIRVLVADDQVDVARTLCRPLVAEGATVRVVSGGSEALACVRAGGFDLCVADMKMPPLPWGGLWLLNAMQDGRLTVPLLVLSGEGTQRQTIQAMRLGAVDWIDKASAGTELLNRCEAAIATSRAAGPKLVGDSGPSPIAHAYARYRQAVGTERQISEGLHAMEETVRFVALVGLSTCDVGTCGPLQFLIDRIGRPSLGTWVEIAAELSTVATADPIFRSLAAAVLADGRKPVDRFVQLRNDLHHGGAEPGAAQGTGLTEMLATWAARITAAWPYRPAAPTSMQYDGDNFDVAVEEFTGVAGPQPSRVRSRSPLHTGRPILIRPEGDPVPLWPWFAASSSPSTGASANQLLVFDGVRQARRGVFDDCDQLVYSDPASGARNLTPEAGAAWSEAAHWFAPHANG